MGAGAGPLSLSSNAWKCVQAFLHEAGDIGLSHRLQPRALPGSSAWRPTVHLQGLRGAGTAAASLESRGLSA
jgi:hypothetical protein